MIGNAFSGFQRIVFIVFVVFVVPPSHVGGCVVGFSFGPVFIGFGTTRFLFVFGGFFSRVGAGINVHVSVLQDGGGRC